MFTINLNQLEFFSYHGLHEEERVIGNTFLVDLELAFEAGGNIQGIEQTIDYSAVYSLVKNRMAKPALLLETLAQDIVSGIHGLDSRISFVRVSITKKSAPITGLQGNVGVSCSQSFK